ncbi:MAG TPA: phosphatidate cytidylyltransferase [Tissierellaceae bacterium]|nr:phosphatidate cytidylyltransferase [Tissierellaceae bacterium]
MSNLNKRFFSGLIGFLLLVLIVIKGGFLLKFSIYIVAMIGLREFYKAVENINVKPLYFVGYLGSTAIFLNILLNLELFNIILTLLIIVTLGSMVFLKKIKLEDISITLIGVFYIPFLLFHIMYLSDTKYIWLIFIIAFGTDTFAYIVGNLLGKRKLCPRVSPNKTIEGSIGGIIGSIILSLIYSKIYELGDLWIIFIISFIGSIVAQIGDLTASKIKRQVEIKDYGFIMPGHGGVLDRFDSILFTAPLIYYCVSNFLI